MGRLERVTEFFGLRRSIVGLLGMVVLVGMGERMSERFLPIYLLALTGWQSLPGLLNGLNNILGALYSFPGGYLATRLGTKRSLLVFNLIAILGFTIVLLIPSWVAVFVGAVFYLSWTAVSLPATMDLVAKVLPKTKRTMGVSMHSLVRRIPMAVGPIIGGVLIDSYGVTKGVRIAFGGALVLALVALVMQQLFIAADQPGADGKPRPAAEKNPLRVLADMCPELRQLLVSDILIRFCEQIPYAYMAVWAMEVPDGAQVSGEQFGLLTAIEMAVAVLCYIPVASLADRGQKKPFVVATFVFFTLFPLVLLFSRTFWMLAVAFIIRGLKEFGEPTRKALIMDLAPEGRKAAMFGTYYLVRDIIVSVAAFGSAFLWAISPQVNFLTAFAFGAAGTLWFVLRGRDLGKA